MMSVIIIDQANLASFLHRLVKSSICRANSFYFYFYIVFSSLIRFDSLISSSLIAVSAENAKLRSESPCAGRLVLTTIPFHVFGIHGQEIRYCTCMTAIIWHLYNISSGPLLGGSKICRKPKGTISSITTENFELGVASVSAHPQGPSQTQCMSSHANHLQQKLVRWNMQIRIEKTERKKAKQLHVSAFVFLCQY